MVVTFTGGICYPHRIDTLQPEQIDVQKHAYLKAHPGAVSYQVKGGYNLYIHGTRARKYRQGTYLKIE